MYAQMTSLQAEQKRAARKASVTSANSTAPTLHLLYLWEKLSCPGWSY